MLAWFVATNHCAAEMGGAAQASGGSYAAASPSSSHGDCPAHHSGDQQKRKGAGDSAACCKDFSKAAQTDNSSPQFKNTVLRLVVFFEVLQLSGSELKADLNPDFLDSGPPASFAEIVLQRSVLAHAPPVLA